MLIGAFQIHHFVARLSGEIRPLIEDTKMRNARIEPDIENIADLFVMFSIGAEHLVCIDRVPCVRTFAFDALRDQLH